MEIKDRAFVVTGAGNGIGREVVRGDVPERLEQAGRRAVAVVARHHVFEFVRLHGGVSPAEGADGITGRATGAAVASAPAMRSCDSQ